MRINALTSTVIKILLWMVLCGCAVSAIALEDRNITQLSDYLLQEKTSLSQAIGKAHAYSTPVDVRDLKKKRVQVEHLLTLNQVKINSLDSFLAYQNRKLQQLSQRLKQLQQAVVGKKKAQVIQEKIERINSERAVTADSIQLIKENLRLAHSYQDVLENVLQELILWESRHAMEDELERLVAQERSVQSQLSEFYKKALALQQQRNKADAQDSLSLDESILINTQEINLLQLTLAELNLQRKLLRASYSLHEHPDIKTLQQVETIYQTSIAELSAMERQSLKMANVLDDERQQSTSAQIKASLGKLLNKVQDRAKKIHDQHKRLKTELENVRQEIKKRLSSRQTFSDYKTEGVVEITWQIAELPNKFWQYLKGLAYKVRDNYVWMDSSLKYLAWCSLIAIGILLTWFNYFLSRYLMDKNRSRLTGHLFDGFLMLVKRNMLFITMMVFIEIIFIFTQIPLLNYKLLGTIFIVWLIFRVLIQIARMVLLERISDASGKDVRLYHRLRRLFLIGGWTTVLMVIAHQLPSTLIVQDILNRLFMIFLMALALAGFRSRDAIHHLLYPFLKTRKRYVRTAILMMVFLLPFCLAITAVIGLVGYFNIAWSMSIFLMHLVLVLSAYILLRGLMFDGLELLSEWMIKTLKNGWLWIEVILKPIDKILRVVLLIAALASICGLIGWHIQMPLLTHVMEVLDYKLVNISGIHITVKSLVEFIILISIFMWAAKWTREFGYRYLYRNARDAGIRNSFSVFTQYAVVLVGGLITLRVLGIDVSGMSVILGGLAVGMGFGLRDFASNIVGGLMLLIERPVREGDLITLGNYEGRVAHIGIRSMRVSSWDNMEVLIPNAETFNKPFTNWTHQDSIVRTVIPIKVSRSDDPIVVQGLILDVLAIIPEVLPEPPSQVYLKQIDDALIEFEVRYYINVEQHTRFEVRSKVLFAITAQFKAAGVKPPIPPLSVEIKEGELFDAFVNSHPTTRK